MKSAYATAAIDPKISSAGSHCGPPSATSRRNSDREDGDVRVPNRIPTIAPMVMSFLAVVMRLPEGLRCRLSLRLSCPNRLLNSARWGNDQGKHDRNCHYARDHMKCSAIGAICL